MSWCCDKWRWPIQCLDGLVVCQEVYHSYLIVTKTKSITRMLTLLCSRLVHTVGHSALNVRQHASSVVLWLRYNIWISHFLIMFDCLTNSLTSTQRHSLPKATKHIRVYLGAHQMACDRNENRSQTHKHMNVNESLCRPHGKWPRLNHLTSSSVLVIVTPQPDRSPIASKIPATYRLCLDSASSYDQPMDLIDSHVY